MSNPVHTKRFEVFAPEKPMAQSELLDELERRGFRPSTESELITWHQENPEASGWHSIIALGDLGGGYSSEECWYPCLVDGDITSVPVRSTWNENSRFLIVPKS